MLWGMKFMIRHDKEAQNESKTMASACGIYESRIINICVFMLKVGDIALSLHYKWAEMLLNSLFVSILKFILESVLACWPVIACILVNIG